MKRPSVMSEMEFNQGLNIPHLRINVRIYFVKWNIFE